MSVRIKFAHLATVLMLSAVGVPSGSALAGNAAALPETRVVSIGKPFDAMVLHLEQAIKDNNMALVAQASASRAAASRGVKIPGNMVLMVFRNDYAVRMLEASAAAGIEAPLRIYVTEQADGSTRLSYPLPSAVFRPYGDARIDAMAQELDPIFERIVRDATASGDVQRH